MPHANSIAKVANDRCEFYVTRDAEKSYRALDRTVKKQIAMKLMFGRLLFEKVEDTENLYRISLPCGCRATAIRNGNRVIINCILRKGAVERFYHKYQESAKVRDVKDYVPLDRSAVAAQLPTDAVRIYITVDDKMRYRCIEQIIEKRAREIEATSIELLSQQCETFSRRIETLESQVTIMSHQAARPAPLTTAARLRKAIRAILPRPLKTETT